MREGCFCRATVAMETSRDKRGKKLPETMTSELKTGYSCPSHSHNPIPAGFCSSWAVGVVALMEEGKQLFSYLVDGYFHTLHNPTKQIQLFWSHTLLKKRKKKRKQTVKLLFPPPKLSTPLKTKRKYHRFNLNYHFQLQWVGGGE